MFLVEDSPELPEFKKFDKLSYERCKTTFIFLYKNSMNEHISIKPIFLITAKSYRQEHSPLQTKQKCWYVFEVHP